MADLNLVASIGNSIQAPALNAATQQLQRQLQSINGATQLNATSNTDSNNPVSFADILKNTLDHVNQAQQHATELTREFQLGNPKVTLEESMIAGQIASLQLQTVVQVRNKLTDAYQSIMNMPV
jgi:flagellar hook-basal body complex protein FliE